MDRKYWEKIAPDYNEEIFDVLHNDRKGLIRNAISSVAGENKSVIDIGCAVGKWLPVLSPLYKKVTAVDISARNLTIASKSYSHLRNISYKRVDFSTGKTSYKNFDTAVCINAILTEKLQKRKVFFQNISQCLKKNGNLVLVVPSLESWMMTRIIQHQWQIDKKLFAGKLSDREGHRRYQHMMQGNVEIDNVATKHYLLDELGLLLSMTGMKVVDSKKINYSWSTEFINPPSWLREPEPWDWLVVAQKK